MNKTQNTIQPYKPVKYHYSIYTVIQHTTQQPHTATENTSVSTDDMRFVGSPTLVQYVLPITDNCSYQQIVIPTLVLCTLLVPFTWKLMGRSSDRRRDDECDLPCTDGLDGPLNQRMVIRLRRYVWKVAPAFSEGLCVL